jgi:hypothetical protein
MTNTISSNLQKDKEKLEKSYFRTSEIDKELGFSTALISDISRARRKQRMVCFFLILVIILAIFTFPFFRFQIFRAWQNHTLGGGDVPGPESPPKDVPPTSPDQKGPLN